jgi:phosphoribosylformylglycinamidine cyclo-ligase
VTDASSGTTYASAGVDTAAGDRAVELMKAAVSATHGPQVLGGVGGFAGLFDASALTAYRRPLLATSTDGVGTKVAIAQALGIHGTIGQDLVAMVVDDLVVCGAQPLFMTDYIACGRVVPETVAALVEGIARACGDVGAALVGGETAEHPGLMAPGEYDVAGAATGVVEADALLGPDRVRAGDAVVALASSGLHANGYSLVRRIVADAGWSLEQHLPELGRTLGEELLEPTRLYTRPCLALARDTACDVHAFSHVTGGGLAANLARVLPRELDAVVDRSTWTPPAVFGLLGAAGGVPTADAEGTWNLGVGMVAVVGAGAASTVLARLAELGLPAWVAGEVVQPSTGGASPDSTDAAAVRGAKGVDGGGVALVGEHPR